MRLRPTPGFGIRIILGWMVLAIVFSTCVPGSLGGQVVGTLSSNPSDLIPQRAFFRNLLTADLFISGPSPDRSFPVPQGLAFPDSIKPQRGVATLVVSGVLAWGAGVGVGGKLGYHAERKGALDVDSGELGGFLLGAAVGSALLVPVTVHLVNHRRGSLPLDLLATAAATVVPALLAAHAEGGAQEVWTLTVPVLQIATAIWVERRTGR